MISKYITIALIIYALKDICEICTYDIIQVSNQLDIKFILNEIKYS